MDYALRENAFIDDVVYLSARTGSGEHERRNEKERVPPPRFSRLGSLMGSGATLALTVTSYSSLSLPLRTSIYTPIQYLTFVTTCRQRSLIEMSDATPAESQSEIQINVKGELGHPLLRTNALVKPCWIRGLQIDTTTMFEQVQAS